MKISRTLKYILCLLFILSVTFSGHSENAKEQFVYFGTFSKTGGKGIYVSRLDLSTGKLTPAELAAETGSAGFLAIHPNHRFLYSVGELTPPRKTSGAVNAFAIDRKTGKLVFLNQKPSGGKGPAHLTVDKSGKCVLVANYGGGSIAALPIQPDGKVSEATASIQHTGSSVHPQRQKEPHAHSINVDAANHFAFVADLGLDKILVYKLDPAKGTLVANDPPSVSVTPGAGPRHFAFHPNGKFAYVINEIHCSITAFSYDASRGELHELQTISTLPEGQAVETGFSTAEVQVHPSGKFLYGSNRGHNTIAVFSIDEQSGKLKLLQNESTQGKVPRNFGVDPTGQFLLAANQDSDNVVVFRIDPTSGRLAATGQSIPVPMPVCVKFLPVEPAGFIDVTTWPGNDDVFPGKGPVQKAPWFQGLWSALRGNWWKNREKDKGAVVFLGDSITQGWTTLAKDFEKYKVANRGISGDTTRGVWYRLKEDVLDLEPAAIVLLIGTNDLGLEGGEPEQVAENLKGIFAAIKKHNPKTPVIVCKVMPSSEKMQRPADKIKKLNALVDEMIKSDSQFLRCDTWSIFADETGSAKKEEFPDLLHPNAVGYVKWAEALKPILSQLKIETVKP